MSDPITNRHGDMAPNAYDPNSPLLTNYVERLWRIANVAAGLPPHERPDRMFLPAKDYGAVIAEMRAQHGAPISSVPGYLIFGKNPAFYVVNSGTDDIATVDRMNRDTPGAMDFKSRIRRFKPVGT